jgi:hypoxanthine-guanine phosphoribosyltransferase
MSNQSLIDRYPCLESVFMDRGAIASRVAALAEVMCRDYGDCERLCLMVILKGACFFACD